MREPTYTRYEKRQRERGLVLVKIWVPAEARERVLRLGKKLRKIARANETPEK